MIPSIIDYRFLHPVVHLLVYPFVHSSIPTGVFLFATYYTFATPLVAPSAHAYTLLTRIVDDNDKRHIQRRIGSF